MPLILVCRCRDDFEIVEAWPALCRCDQNNMSFLTVTLFGKKQLQTAIDYSSMVSSFSVDSPILLDVCLVDPDF